MAAARSHCFFIRYSASYCAYYWDLPLCINLLEKNTDIWRIWCSDEKLISDGAVWFLAVGCSGANHQVFLTQSNLMKGMIFIGRCFDRVRFGMAPTWGSGARGPRTGVGLTEIVATVQLNYNVLQPRCPVSLGSYTHTTCKVGKNKSQQLLYT